MHTTLDRKERNKKQPTFTWCFYVWIVRIYKPSVFRVNGT